MSVWFFLGLMTVAAVFAVLWPLSRRSPQAHAASHDAAVYEHQLRDLAREREQGLIAEGEAAALRTEIARRLLAAADAGAAPFPADSAAIWRRRAVTIGVIVALPLIAVGAYLALGSPELPGAPLSARITPAGDAAPLTELIARVEAHLEKNPDDGRGWEVLAPVYTRLGRFDDAVKARSNVVRLSGATAQREADLGEAITGASNGIVTAEAKQAFDRAIALDAMDAKARFFLGLATEQDGRREDALVAWRALLADTRPDAPWLSALREAIARLDPDGATLSSDPQAGPSNEEVAAASALDPEQRNEMIRGMVDRLSARLRQDGGDLEGWLRLIRSYTVLGESDKARAAARDARHSLANDTEKLRRIDDLSRALGLES